MGKFTKTLEVGRECTFYAQILCATAVDVPGTGTLLSIQAEGQAIRYRLDGTAPTSTVGTIIAAGACEDFNLTEETRQNLKIIEVTTTAKANIHVFK